MNPARLTPFFLSNNDFLWTSAAAAAATHKIIYCSEKCKTKCHIFGLLSVTSVKCTHGWIAPVYFLGMVKNEEIVTILEHFQLLFPLLSLLNRENAFISGDFKGKIFQMFGFASPSPLVLLLLIFATEKRRRFSNGECGPKGKVGGWREEENLKRTLFQSKW